MNSKVIVGIVVAAVAIFGIVLFTSISGDDNTESNAQSTSSDSDAQNTYTKAEVAVHTDESDCWTIIDGSVYDLTEYIPRHVGGDEILLACGQDGTSLFERRTTAEGEEIGSGTPHSDRAEAFLADLKIGTLKI